MECTFWCKGGVPGSSKYIKDQIIKLQSWINRELQMHMEMRVLVSNLLGKCGVIWSLLSDDIQDFNIHLIMRIYGESAPFSGKDECLIVFLTLVIFIWRDLRKLHIQAEMAYGSEYQ